MNAETPDTPDPFGPGATPEGRYTIIRELGRGAFGGVYLVSQADLKRFFALKRLLPERQIQADVREMFRREAEIWIRLNPSAYLVRAHWVDRIHDELCLALEYIPADHHGRTTLADHLASSSPVHQRLAWAVHCCRGMQDAHAGGVVAHRDLKPANVLIDQRGVARITDFGIALLAQMGGGGLAGTPAYMAPETFTDSLSAGPQSDAYSFGVMLFQMMTGRLPFTPLTSSLGAWLNAHMRSPVPSIDFPGGDLVRSCLDKDPTNRPQSFAEIEERLEQVRTSLGASPLPYTTQLEITASDLNNRAMSFFTLGYCAEALECLDRALAFDPGFARAWSNKGAFLSDSGAAVDHVMKCYKKALDLDNSLSFPWTGIGFIHMMRGDFVAALEAYDSAVALDPAYLPAHHDRAKCLLRLGRTADAIGILEKIVKIDPGGRLPWRSLAEAYVINREVPRAVAAYERALGIGPDADAEAGYGELLLGNGQAMQAETALRRAVAIDTHHPRARYVLGQMAERKGDFKRAQEHFETALASHPESAQCWFGLGNARRVQGDFAGALACFKKTMTYSPAYQPAWVNAGGCLLDLGEAKEAVAFLVQATRLDPDDVIAWSSLASAQETSGAIADAYASYRNVLARSRVHHPEMHRYAEVWLRKHEDRRPL